MSFKSPGISITLFVCSLIAFASCKNVDPNVRVVTIANEYSVEIPNHLVETDELNKDASLQYMDTTLDFAEFIIVISEPKDDFIKNFANDSIFGPLYDKNASAAKNYSTIEMAIVKDKAKLAAPPHIQETKINGLDAEMADFVGQPDNLEDTIYYKVAFIEGKKNLYMVMAWTMAETKDKYNAEMEKMLNSFKLVE